MFLQETKAYLSSSSTSVNVFLTSLDDGLKVALFKKLCNGVHFGAQQRDARAEVNLWLKTLSILRRLKENFHISCLLTSL